MTFKNDNHEIKIVGKIVVIDGKAYASNDVPIKYKIENDVLKYRTSLFHVEKLYKC